ncbi:MAG: UDP-2,3-diacylglucosamine diphosphatase [Gemmatales bacterium]
MHALILSDLHLGVRNCQHPFLLQRLASSSIRSFSHIILNGDIVDHFNFEQYQQADWTVIDRLKQLASEERLVFVQGNHDRPRRAAPQCRSRQLLSEMLKVEMLTEMTLMVDGERFLLLHGDQYDQTLNMTRLGCVAEAVYRQTQRWHQPTSRWLKRQSKSLLGIEAAVRQKALADARCRGFAGVILGHTHYACDEVDHHGIRYVNSGSWVDDACTYLELRHERLSVREWRGEGIAHEPVILQDIPSIYPAMVY